MSENIPLSSDDKPTCEDVLKYYNNSVVDKISVAATTVSAFPVEVLNEIRAAFTHTAKAHIEKSVNADTFHEENRCALRHLKRVSLDCLKLSLLSVAQKLEKDVSAIEQDGVLFPKNIYEQIHSLRDRRKNILRRESTHPTTQTIDELAILLNDFDSLADSLREEYNTPFAKALRKRTWWLEQKRLFIGLLGGFIFGIAASLVSSIIYSRF